MYYVLLLATVWKGSEQTPEFSQNSSVRRITYPLRFMAPTIAFVRPRADTSSGGSGTGQAIQSFLEFFATNIIAHTATIRIPAGTNFASSVQRVITALVLPVSAGDPAFRALGRWATHWRKPNRRKGIPWYVSAFPGDKLRDAGTSGAVAICVPLEFAPLLAGRWERVSPQRRAVFLDGTDFWRARRKRPELPFPAPKPTDIFPRYCPFILPPNTHFNLKQYKSNKISPSGSALTPIIAIVQIVLSTRQLYLNYGSSITDKGLSSPYLVVIPYMLMSFINLVASVLVGSYRQITVLPMEKDKFPDINEGYLVKCLDKECPGKPTCSKHHRRILALDHLPPPKSVPASGDQEGRDKSTVDLSLKELKGREWILVTEGVINDDATVMSKRIFSLWLIELWREEKWTSLWYKVRFEVYLMGRKKAQVPPEGELAKRKEVIFFKHRFITTWIEWPWSLLKRRAGHDIYSTDLIAFKSWLKDNYKYLEIPLKRDRYRRGIFSARLGYSYLASGIFLQVLVTIILGGLTRFEVGIRSHAAWALTWMYGGPMLRYRWLNDHSMNREPCLNHGKWLLFFFDRILVVPLVVGICGGVAVISVELFGDFSNTTYSLATGTWALAAFLIGALFFVVVLIIIGLGRLIKFVVERNKKREVDDEEGAEYDPDIANDFVDAVGQALS